MKIYYHGTTADVVASIKRDGLRPELERAYNFLNMNMLLGQILGIPEAAKAVTNDRTQEGFVFLTADFKVAELFAEFRASYEMYPPDSILGVGTMKMYKQPGEYQRVGKIATPVVLEFHVPESIAARVKVDERAADDLKGFRYHGIVPARTLKKVIPVDGLKGLEYDPQETRFKKAA